MDFEVIKQGFNTAVVALSFIKQAKELLPQGSKKDEVDEALQKAERQLKLAESQLAQGLGYQLCKKHFPPQIMLSADERNWKCPDPDCGNEKRPSPPILQASYRRKMVGEE